MPAEPHGNDTVIAAPGCHSDGAAFEGTFGNRDGRILDIANSSTFHIELHDDIKGCTDRHHHLELGGGNFLHRNRQRYQRDIVVLQLEMCQSGEPGHQTVRHGRQAIVIQPEYLQFREPTKPLIATIHPSQCVVPQVEGFQTHEILKHTRRQGCH